MIFFITLRFYVLLNFPFLFILAKITISFLNMINKKIPHQKRHLYQVDYTYFKKLIK